ncbi:MAG: hypothetical protein Q8O10_11025 [candidate division Zixibacteria bacterium]|nr:hypothetical protein [candidate division Zixibacteria bacterium]
MSGTRVLVTTGLGFIFGIIAYLMTRGMPGLSAGIYWSIVFEGGILGFIIGISGFKFNYVLHGLIIGAIVYFPAALPALPMGGFVRYWVSGMVYGALIEIISHLIIREKASEAPAV